MAPTSSLAPTAAPLSQPVPSNRTIGRPRSLGVDLAGKRGCYFSVSAGALTGLATVAAYVQDSADNGNWTNVNVTTYPDATLAASNTASSTREMWVRRDQVAQYVRVRVVVAANTALVNADAHTY